MKVTITTGGHTVEVETDEKLRTQQLINLAVNAWRRTVAREQPGPAGYGFSSQIDAEDPFRQTRSRHRWLDEGRPLDAS